MRPARKNRKIEENKSGPAGGQARRERLTESTERNRIGVAGLGNGAEDGRGRKKRKRHRGTSRRIIRVAACAYAPLFSPLRFCPAPANTPFRNASLYFSLSLSFSFFFLLLLSFSPLLSLPLSFFRSFLLSREDEISSSEEEILLFLPPSLLVEED